MWHADHNSRPAPARLTRYEAENLYMVWLSKDHNSLDVADKETPCRPPRGLSGDVMHRTEPNSRDVVPQLSSVLMRYF